MAAAAMAAVKAIVGNVVNVVVSGSSHCLSKQRALKRNGKRQFCAGIAKG